MNDTTRTTPVKARSREELELLNAEQPINKLPVEVISRIFTIGEQMDRNDDDDFAEDEDDEDEDDEGPDLEFQELVSQVCRHWRTIAINMPTLWTYISLGDPIPYERSAMFLARSGDTVPLEIEIDMDKDFMDGLDELDGPAHAKRAQEALEFIVSHGGITSRWGTLVVWSEMPDVTLAIIDYISSAPLDSLHTLQLFDHFSDPSGNDDFTSEALLGRDLSKSVIFRSQPPLLRRVELFGIPTDFFFARESEPLVSNLTRLELGVVVLLPPLIGLRELFLHNPRLETLALDMGMLERIDFQNQPTAVVRVSMPHLRQFTLREPISVDWALSVLKMIDAPGVEMFSLNLNQSDGETNVIMEYIGRGRKGNQLAEDHMRTDIDGGSIYPVLKHFVAGPFSGSDTPFKDMLKAFQNITRLDWEVGPYPIWPAMGDVAICPQLEYLRVYQVFSDDLHDLVRERAKRGRPLKTVEVNSRDWHEIPESIKRSLREELVKFGPYVDDDEDETDSEEEEDDDDEGGYTDTGSDEDDLSDPSDADRSGDEWEDETDSEY